MNPHDHYPADVTEDDLDDLMDEDMPVALADAIVQHPPTPPATPKFKRKDDPSLPFYPRGLVLDLVMKTVPLPDLLQAYNVTEESFRIMLEHPIFRQEVRDMKNKLKDEGFSFKVKAQAQAEAYLHTAWNIVNDPETPANVRADLIKWTVKVGGLEAPPASQTTTTAQDLSKLAEELKSLPADQIELRAFQIIMRKSPPPQDSGHVIEA